MKSLIWKSKSDKTIELTEKQYPKIIDDRDAIVKVTLSSICTSDLHIKNGFVPKAREGVTLGHEFVGEIAELGKNISGLKIGDRVSVNCETFCGNCYFCKRGFINNCQSGGWLLGCSVDGCQAEYVRVPYADKGLTKIPDNLSYKNALFVGDILASGYFGTELCEVSADDTVVVIGAGPVGLCSMACAKIMEAKKVIGIDINPERLNIARKQGLADYVFNPSKDNIDEEIKNLTGGRGADKVIEASEKFYEEHKIPINDKLVLITAHRRENHGERIDRIIDAIEKLAISYSDHTFVIPVHPNPNVKNKIHERLGCLDNIKLLTPLDYPYLVYLMKHAKLILTDSGGIQEEAPSFSCPTLVMRYETERKEGIEAGVSVLVGADYDKILEYSENVLSKDKLETRLQAQNPYGDGTASKKIEKIIRSKLLN